MEYQLIRSARRTVALEIDRQGRVILRAPLRMPQKQIDDFFEAHQAWLRTHLEQQQARMAAHPEPDERQQKILMDRAAEILPQKVAYYGEIMGLKPTGITITGARTRFGSCSPRNRLCFSWRLMEYPEDAVDYVVVHELAHLVHRNHGPAFHALVGSVLPDQDRRRAMLKE